MLEPIFFLALLVLVARLFEEIMFRIGQSQILGDVLAGIILGPAILGLVEPIVEIRFLINLGLFFFFFIIGSREIDLPTLRRVLRRRLFPAALIAFAIPVMLCNIFLLSHNIDLQISLILSGLIGLSSLSVLARSLSDLKMMKTHIGLETFGFVAIIEFVGLMYVSILHEFYLFGATDGLQLTIYLITNLVLFVTVVSIISFIVAPRILRRVHRHMQVSEASFGIIASLIMLVVWFSESLGIHGSLGALILGLGLSDFFDSPEHINMIQGFRSISYGLFIPLFFAGAGLYLNFSIMNMFFAFVLSFFVIVVVGKFIGGILGARLAHSNNTLFWGVGVLSKGGVELALALSLLESSILDENMFSLFLTVLFVMLLSSPILLRRLTKQFAIDTPISTIEEEMLPLYCRYTYLNLQVKDVMSSSKAKIQWNISLSQFMREHLRLGYRDYFVVDDDDHLVGLLCVIDLNKVPENQYDTILVRDIMRKAIPILTPNTTIHLAVEILLNEGINRLPVVLPEDPRTVVGTFDRGDVVKILLSHLEKRDKIPV